MVKTGEFLENRIYKGLGLKASKNKVKIRKEDEPDIYFNSPIFSSDRDDNIDILVWSLDRFIFQYSDVDGDPTKPGQHNEHINTYKIKRLKNPKNEMKYVLPKKLGTMPFIPSSVIDKYENKKQIKTLVLTEGYIKAFKGSMHGLDIIGLSSITTYKDKKTQRIHLDISRIITECKVENVLILYDGDCSNISDKALKNNDDLYLRPNTFFSSIKNIHELLIDFNVSVWFCNVISESHKDNPKGIDDLLISLKDSENDVINDLLQYSAPGRFFNKIRVINNRDFKKIANYLHISSSNDFYAAHEEKIQDKEFVFNGTCYRFDSKSGENGKLRIVKQKEADDYFRVGDTYYEKIMVPNKYGMLEQRYDPRKKTTITDDFGKSIIENIPKYKSFCNVPDHVNFQPIIENCYNIYYPFKHIPEQGTIEYTIMFLNHIFNEQIDIGLDYLQLLYKEPKQVLPILCLVSRENMTGKTMFLNWLKEIFEQNMAIVGNSELTEQFNASYATKLIIGCDEALIDKDVVINKIKAMSTNGKINMRAMQRDYTEIDFFGKFILLSNFENNFVKANEFDVRYWVRKIPVVQKNDVHLLDKLIDEIPAFLYFLDNRKLVHECRTRMYFDEKILQTEALQKVRENSQSTVSREIKGRLKEMFLEMQEYQFLIDAKNIKEIFFKGKVFEISYITRVMEEELKVKRYKDGKPCRFEIPHLNSNNDKIYEKFIGRPFDFRAEQFLTSEELIMLESNILDATILEAVKTKDESEAPY